MSSNRRDSLINWGIFILLSFIWGASFKLIKVGMDGISAYQLAALRIFSAGIVLLPFAIKAFREVPRNKIGTVLLSGLLGSFFPAFLFCIAETKIDSSLAGILNALTPVFTLVIGILFFQGEFVFRKLLGILISFTGSALCMYFKSRGQIELAYFGFAALVLLATICYGVNVNMVGKYLKGVTSLHIASVAFVLLIIPSLLVLVFTGFFRHHMTSNTVLTSIASGVFLGVMGTAFASILFYVLLKRAGVFFSSLVTYGIPVVAIVLGTITGEYMTIPILLSLFLILTGVYLANRK